MVDITIFEVHLGNVDVPTPFESGGGEVEETEISIEESGEGGGLGSLLVTLGAVVAVAAIARRLRDRRRAREGAAQTTVSSE